MMIKKTLAAALINIACIQLSYASELYVYEKSDGIVLLTNKTHNNAHLAQKTKFIRSTTKPSQAMSALDIANTAETPWKGVVSSAYTDAINAASERYDLDSHLIRAVIHTESAFNTNARSHAGARGLMQLMPATARRFKVSNSYDPHQNIKAGAQYLRWLLNRYNGNLSLALAGYNAGEGNVDKYKGIPPFRETQNYVKRVLRIYQSLDGQHRPVASVEADPSTAQQTLTKIVKYSTSSFGDVFSTR